MKKISLILVVIFIVMTNAFAQNKILTVGKANAMKRNIVIFAATLLISIFSVFCIGCSKEEISGVYYISGYNMQSGIDIQNETGNAGVYLFISKNLKDTVATNNLPNDLFIFPKDIFGAINECGLILFPQEYRFAYEVKMTYRPMTEKEEKEMNFVCTGNLLVSQIKATNVIIKSISKI
jgi:hypothetical protein